MFFWAGHGGHPVFSTQQIIHKQIKLLLVFSVLFFRRLDELALYQGAPRLIHIVVDLCDADPILWGSAEIWP